MASTEDGDFIRMSNSMTDVASARYFIVAIEDAEARRYGQQVKHVRSSVASKLRTPPGTLENIRRGRSKIIPNWLMDRIRSHFVAVLQSEIQRLEHEILRARQTGYDNSDDTLVSAEAQVAAAKQTLFGNAK